ncbi:hypothetical protein GCM10010104_67830 [Streptomyces indiaensis]|uniref:Uncharacterized protein n=1 Tax=Streptomyces indiaensis TaxID=284033 RepID=A0ABN3EJQ5_9ACTN
MRGTPLAEPPGVGERGATADHRAGRLDVGARRDERVEHRHVVAAGRPVQRRLRVRPVETGTRIGPGGDQDRDRLGTAREVPRPVGRDVQQAAGAPAVLLLLGDACPGETGMLDEQLRQPAQVPAPDRLRDGYGQGSRDLSVCKPPPDAVQGLRFCRRASARTAAVRSGPFLPGRRPRDTASGVHTRRQNGHPSGRRACTLQQA